MQLAGKGFRRIVRDVDVDAVEALVGRPDGTRQACAAQDVVCGLRHPAGVDQPPAGARDEIARLQHERAGARRARPAPLPDDLGHHLSAHQARELEVELRVRRAQRDGFDVVEERQVVITDVVEVPACAGVARDAALPRGMRRRDPARHATRQRVERRLLGNVREREALAGEADSRRPRVRQRPEVGADAEVVGDALSCAERQVAAARR